MRGVAAVEAAIATPVFLLLLMAGAEVGRALYEYDTLIKAVRLGAGHIAERALTGGGVIELETADVTAAKNLVVYGSPAGGGEPLLEGLGTGDVTVVAADAVHVTVTASFNYVPLFGALPSFGGGGAMSASFQAACTMAAL